MSGRVMADSHIRLPTASLTGQSPPDSLSCFGPRPAPEEAGISEMDCTSNRFIKLSTYASCGNLIVPSSTSLGMHQQGIHGIRAYLVLPRLGPRAHALECGYLAVPPLSVRFSPREFRNVPLLVLLPLLSSPLPVLLLLLPLLLLLRPLLSVMLLMPLSALLEETDDAGEAPSATPPAPALAPAAYAFRIAGSTCPTSVTSRSDSPSKSTSTLPSP